MMTEKIGKIFFISGPSGVGKGTLINALRERHGDWVFPPSCTTRDPRPGEIDGETYYFISREEFRKRIAAGDFLEYAEVHGGNLYGTLQQKLIEPMQNGKIVIREFDVQGYTQAVERLPREYYESIFLYPADGVEELVRRIKERAPIADEEVERRLESMRKELDKAELYDHWVYSKAGEIDDMVVGAEAVILKSS